MFRKKKLPSLDREPADSGFVSAWRNVAVAELPDATGRFLRDTEGQSWYRAICDFAECDKQSYAMRTYTFSGAKMQMRIFLCADHKHLFLQGSYNFLEPGLEA